MKWFKHLTGSLKDPMIVDCISEFGGDGYMVFFGILDLMAEDYDKNNPGICSFSVKYLTKNLQVTRVKLLKILSFFEKYPKENGKIQHEINGDRIILKCMRLKELSDDWTQRTTRELHRSYTEVTSSPRARSQEVEVEVDLKDITPHIAPPTTEQSAYDNPLKNWHTTETQEMHDRALGVLHAINTEYKKRFPDNYFGLQIIMERLEEGRTEEECERIIAAKKNDPHFLKHREFLCPETLFSREHFDRYLSEYIEKAGEPQEPSASDIAEKEQRIQEAADTRKVLTHRYHDLTIRFHEKIADWKSYLTAPSREVFIDPLICIAVEKGKVTLWTEHDSAFWVQDHYAETIGSEIGAEIIVTDVVPEEK